MELKAKYHYTHFIYPFVIEENKNIAFLQSLLSKEKLWKFKIDEQKNDSELYNFFLPYMRKFLFPTLFWSKDYIKQFKGLSPLKKAYTLNKLSCSTFEYNLSSIKTGDILDEKYDQIHFDICSIQLVCFEQGNCFLDIKAEIDEGGRSIDFNKILDFNYFFRELTPRAVSSLDKVSNIKGKKIDDIQNIAKFIGSITKGYESNDLEKIYYDKMFTYSYVCIDGWNEDNDFSKFENEFYKYQYVINSKNSALFNKDCERLKQDRYSRWQYSMFGFSRESGVVLVSDKEKFNITKMPYDYEKKYLYMLLLAFYQRMSLINFSQDLLKKDKTKVKLLKKNFTEFTHFSWFSQITNSENGMDIWKRWQTAFELPELFEEVQKEYMEYYDYAVANGQEKMNVLVIMLYLVNIFFAGIQIILSKLNIENIQLIVILMMIISASMYPIFFLVRWIKHKLEVYIDN